MFLSRAGMGLVMSATSRIHSFANTNSHLPLLAQNTSKHIFRYFVLFVSDGESTSLHQSPLVNRSAWNDGRLSSSNMEQFRYTWTDGSWTSRSKKLPDWWGKQEDADLLKAAHLYGHKFFKRMKWVLPWAWYLRGRLSQCHVGNVIEITLNSRCVLLYDN